MATVHEITSLDVATWPLLADYQDLTDVTLRRRLEPANGLFIAEGATVIERAVNAGYVPRSALTSIRWLDTVMEQVAAFEAPVFVASNDLLRELTGFHVHRGALAAMSRRPLPQVADVVRDAQRLVLIEAMVEHTNVGAIFRSAAALGVDAIVLDPRCADPLYRRAVKVSMGAVFAVPWTRSQRWPEVVDDLRDVGFEVWGLTPSPSAPSLDDVGDAVPDRLALLVGTEGPGLSDAALAACDQSVRIPMAAGVDSLNAAAATAVACWQTRPRRLASGPES